MNEIRRFLRYTLPGLAVALIALGALWQIDLFPPGLSGKNNLLAKFVGLFIASGALGYLLANIYFIIRWFPPLQKLLVINHKRILKALETKIEILGPSGQSWKEINNLRRFDAWSILTHYCVSQSKKDESMAAIVNHTESMVDVTHGLGALSTGVTIILGGILFQVFILSEKSVKSQDWFTLGVMLALFIIFWWTFIRSLKALESISNTAFFTSIMEKYHEMNKTFPGQVLNDYQFQKVLIYYDKDEN